MDKKVAAAAVANNQETTKSDLQRIKQAIQLKLKPALYIEQTNHKIQFPFHI